MGNKLEKPRADRSNRTVRTSHTMIPNHARFIEASHETNKVGGRFYSKADNGVLDRVCAPMDYGPGGEIKDGLNRYWLLGLRKQYGPHTLGLVAQQTTDLQVLGEVFDPARLGCQAAVWPVWAELQRRGLAPVSPGDAR